MKFGAREFRISHDGSKQGLRMGVTAGGKNVFVEFSTRRGELGAEYLTRYEADKLIDWLKVKRDELGDNT